MGEGWRWSDPGLLDGASGDVQSPLLGWPQPPVEACQSGVLCLHPRPDPKPHYMLNCVSQERCAGVLSPQDLSM